jgi:hypothetical protein
MVKLILKNKQFNLSFMYKVACKNADEIDPLCKHNLAIFLAQCACFFLNKIYLIVKNVAQKLPKNIRLGVDFTNILQAAFCTAFMCLQFGFVLFWRKDFGTKVAHKILVKLILGRGTK